MKSNSLFAYLKLGSISIAVDKLRTMLVVEIDNSRNHINGIRQGVVFEGDQGVRLNQRLFLVTED